MSGNEIGSTGDHPANWQTDVFFEALTDKTEVDQSLSSSGTPDIVPGVGTIDPEFARQVTTEAQRHALKLYLAAPEKEGEI